MKLASVLAGGDSEDMRLVCGGRVIQDHLSLESQGTAGEGKLARCTKLYCSRSRGRVKDLCCNYEETCSQ